MGVFQNNLLAGAAAAASAGGAGFYSHQIEQSCRFDSASSSFLEAGFDGNSGQTAYTISFWIKRGNLFTGSDQVIMGNSGGWANWHFDNTDSNLEGVNQRGQSTPGALRDTNGWYNIIINQTATQDTVNIWINGVSQTVTSSGSGNFYTPLTNVSSAKLWLGKNSASTYFDGYMAEVILVDGSNKANTDFGEFKNGVWIPIEYSGSFGTDGFHLKFENASDLGNDSSGNNNDFTANNMGADHQVLDSPTFGS